MQITPIAPDDLARSGTNNRETFTAARWHESEEHFIRFRERFERGTHDPGFKGLYAGAEGISSALHTVIPWWAIWSGRYV